MPRRNAKRDANQPDIVIALRGVGALVKDLATVGGGLPDLAVLFRGETHWLEVKADEAARKRKGKTAREQQQFRDQAQARGVHVYVVTTEQEALAAIGAVKT